MRRCSVLFNLIAIAALSFTSPSVLAGITDLDGDGVAVTFLGQGNVPPCGSDSVGLVEVKIENYTLYAGPPAGNAYRLVAVDASGETELLMQVRVPATTIQHLLELYSPPGVEILSGFFTLSFPLHCDGSCRVEGRQDAVGGESFFTYQEPGGPPGPPGGSIGFIGGGGGPSGSGIRIEVVGSSERRCVDLAIEGSVDGESFTGGDNRFCCGEGTVPAISIWGAVAAVLSIGYGAYRQLRPARPDDFRGRPTG
jgi:hypothetical protein